MFLALKPVNRALNLGAGHFILHFVHLLEHLSLISMKTDLFIFANLGAALLGDPSGTCMGERPRLSVQLTPQPGSVLFSGPVSMMPHGLLWGWVLTKNPCIGCFYSLSNFD